MQCGVIRFVVRAQERYTLGESGGMLSQKNYKFRGLWDCFWDLFLGQKDAFGGQKTGVHMNEYLPFCR